MNNSLNLVFFLMISISLIYSNYVKHYFGKIVMKVLVIEFNLKPAK
jgi:hypothetical protein